MLLTSILGDPALMLARALFSSAVRRPFQISRSCSLVMPCRLFSRESAASMSFSLADVIPRSAANASICLVRSENLSRIV